MIETSLRASEARRDGPTGYVAQLSVERSRDSKFARKSKWGLHFGDTLPAHLLFTTPPLGIHGIEANSGGVVGRLFR